MNFVIKIILFSYSVFIVSFANADMRSEVLKKVSLKNGVLPPSEMVTPINKELSLIGGDLFESNLLSLNSDMSCQTCHLDEFSSADGLPNAVGVNGNGSGFERQFSDGKIVPRNTLPLWGRGSINFDTFFWDGKVQNTLDHGVISQFGSALPKMTPLEIAVHLPFVEFREMLIDDYPESGIIKGESVTTANKVYDLLLDRVRMNNKITKRLGKAFLINENELKFSHVVKAIAEFIRDRFKIRTTKFHKFLFGDLKLTKNEIAGGLIFYGKGECSLCHSGAMFSDQLFHTIPFPQIGFGKNGFGKDFGRYNTTFDPLDIYKFRTPPLYNVEKTAPYGHSGSVYSISQAIRYHFDPLWNNEIPKKLGERQQFYSTLRSWAAADIDFTVLDATEVEQLVLFLKTLSFEQVD